MLERRLKEYTLHKPNVGRAYIDSSNDDAFEKDVMRAVRDRGSKPLVAIDMSEITHMSSAGHRVLLMAFKEADKTGGKIALANMSQNLWDKMDLMGFSSSFRKTTLRPLRRRK